MTTDQPAQPLALAAIRARVDAATNGPWMAASNTRRKDGVALVGATADRGTGRAIAVLAGTEVQQRHRDAEFIAAARTDIPALLAEVERLRAVADAAVRWRAQFSKPADTKFPRMAALIEAVDKLTEGENR